jgi:hypothetical protein
VYLEVISNFTAANWSDFNLTEKIAYILYSMPVGSMEYTSLLAGFLLLCAAGHFVTAVIVECRGFVSLFAGHESLVVVHDLTVVWLFLSLCGS